MIYSNFFRSKIDNFQRKISDIFLIFAQNRGGSNEYPQSMFWSKDKKNRCIPQFYYIKVGFKGVFIARTCFPDEV